jgi:hypothetical protein
MDKDNYRIEILNLPSDDLKASPEEMVSMMRQYGFRPEIRVTSSFGLDTITGPAQ